MRLVCQYCQAVLKVPDELLGRRVRCSRCQQVIEAIPTATAVEETKPALSEPAPADTPPALPTRSGSTVGPPPIPPSRPGSAQPAPPSLPAYDPYLGSQPPERSAKSGQGKKVGSSRSWSPSTIITMVVVVLGTSLIGVLLLIVDWKSLFADEDDLPGINVDPSRFADQGMLEGQLGRDLGSMPRILPLRDVTGTMIEPGILLLENSFEPVGQARQPGDLTRLRIYLPMEDSPVRSLACVFIPPAGSDGLTGMIFSEEDQSEHLPYVRQGMVVVAYSIDGFVYDQSNPNLYRRAVNQFADSEAGLTNLRLAITYTLGSLQTVDPDQLYVAGHSSAGTAALVAASYLEGLAGCLAYMPVTDLEAKYPQADRDSLVQDVPASEKIFSEFSPVNRLDEYSPETPIFLFTAMDDSKVSAEEVLSFAEELKAHEINVELKTVESGGHYQAMIDEGIPAAIQWIESQNDR